MAQAVPAPGHRLVVPLDDTNTYLVDANGEVVHTWPSLYLPGVSAYLREDGILVRSISTAPSFGPGGIGGGLQFVELDGTVIWDYRYDGPGYVSHHDIALMPNGNVLLIAWEDRTAAEALQAGRDPADTGSVLRPDRAVEVQPIGPTSGTVVWEWRAWDHLVQDFDPTKDNYHGPTGVADHPELIDVNFPGGLPFAGDWLHFNTVDYDPVHDWVIVTTPAFAEFWVIDHGTTTAEAAGHTGGARGKGGDLLYRWGNPQAYDHGSPADQQLFFPHGSYVIEPGLPGEGHVLVFNNQAPGGSTIDEIVLPLDANGDFVRQNGSAWGPLEPAWRQGGFQSLYVSNCERLPNGHNLVCSGLQQKVFEFDSNGDVVSVFYSDSALFHAHYVPRWLWTDNDAISLATGGRTGLELIAGSQHANLPYMVLGSISGTTPGLEIAPGELLPLNFDGLTLGMAQNANVYPFLNTLGVLDVRGRASAAIDLPGVILAPLAGVRFDHAYVVVDPTTVMPVLISNPVGFDLVP